ncbi:hypothetical protein GQ53DRAFT_330875 [Thozetella sp. PMI_491]|nr:hypothetical protein GQ53DRAFT_330875 [Thozetella sp. PMI_491]
MKGPSSFFLRNPGRRELTDRTRLQSPELARPSHSAPRTSGPMGARPTRDSRFHGLAHLTELRDRYGSGKEGGKKKKKKKKKTGTRGARAARLRRSVDSGGSALELPGPLDLRTPRVPTQGRNRNACVIEMERPGSQQGRFCPRYEREASPIRKGGVGVNWSQPL